MTSDHATGGIVPALQWTPRRGVLFLAGAVVAVGTGTALGVLLAVTAGTGMAVGLGFLLRNTAGTLVSFFLPGRLRLLRADANR